MVYIFTTKLLLKTSLTIYTNFLLAKNKMMIFNLFKSLTKTKHGRTFKARMIKSDVSTVHLGVCRRPAAPVRAHQEWPQWSQLSLGWGG